MKKVLSLIAVAGMLSFYACGPSAEQKAEAERAAADSMRAAEAQMKAAEEAAMAVPMDTAAMPADTNTVAQ